MTELNRDTLLRLLRSIEGAEALYDLVYFAQPHGYITCKHPTSGGSVSLSAFRVIDAIATLVMEREAMTVCPYCDREHRP